jgi:hypothetical protein
MSHSVFDLSDVRFVKRIAIGNPDPSNPSTESEIEAAQNQLNRCLSGSPRGVIIGVEKNFTLFSIGEHQMVVQWLVYHVGFARKPSWL